MNDAGPETHSLWRGPVLAWLSLMVLFGLNLGSAYLPLGAGNITLNLLIAAIMVVVLAAFLMDLKTAGLLVRIVAVAGLFWTVMMFSLTFSDYFTRD